MGVLLNKIKVNWNLYEIVWLLISSAVILGLSFMWDDTLLATISSLTGIISVVLCAKGKISYLYFGIVQCSTYGYIAYTYGLFGESMLNLFFFLPFNIITIFLWRRNLKDKSEVISGEDVHVKKLSKKQWTVLLPVTLVSSILYALFLNLINASQAGLDSIVVVLSVIAQFLLTFRYVEQWIFWIVINTLTIILWVVALKDTGGADMGVLVMWIAFLFNSIYGYVNWSKLSKGESNE